MNKEMIEIMELKDNFADFKKNTEDEIEKINKRVKDGKIDNKKLIQAKFEEMMDTLNYSMEKNPNIAKSEGNTENSEKIAEDEINELTTLVEEIADKMVE